MVLPTRVLRCIAGRAGYARANQAMANLSLGGMGMPNTNAAVAAAAAAATNVALQVSLWLRWVGRAQATTARRPLCLVRVSGARAQDGVQPSSLHLMLPTRVCCGALLQSLAQSHQSLGTQSALHNLSNDISASLLSNGGRGRRTGGCSGFEEGRGWP